MYSAEDVELILQRLLRTLSAYFSIREAFLFGSYATGRPREYSDIDVAIVSDDFRGIRFYDRQLVTRAIVNDFVRHYIDVEVHPFKTEDFTPDNPFVEEILKTGKKITWN